MQHLAGTNHVLLLERELMGSLDLLWVRDSELKTTHRLSLESLY